MYPNRQYANVQQISALGFLTNNTVVNQHMFYVGDCMRLQSRLDEVKNNQIPVKTSDIRIKGVQVKQINVWLCTAIICLGTCFIFPFCLLCFNCCKKIVSAAFNVPISTYQKLQILINNPSTVSVSIQIQDNTFDQQKAKLIYDMLSRSSIKGFKFQNVCGKYDFKKDEWSNFQKNMKPIKSLPILSQIRWHDKLVL